MKRMPPPPKASQMQAHLPSTAQASPAPTPNGTTVVSANNMNGHATNIAEGIKLSEPLKLEPLKTQLFEPIKVTEVLKLADTKYVETKSALQPMQTPAAAPAPVSPTPAAAPVVTQSAPTPTAQTAIPSGAKVNMVNGIGEIELDPSPVNETLATRHGAIPTFISRSDMNGIE
jgi:hypothetical protein